MAREGVMGFQVFLQNLKMIFYEMMQDFSDNDIDALEELADQSTPDHIIREMLNDLRKELVA